MDLWAAKPLIRQGRTIFLREPALLKRFSSRRRSVVVLGALVAATVMATGAAPSAAQKPPRYIDLDKVAKPKITGAEIITGLEEFVEQFPTRWTGTSGNAEAAQFLADEAKKYGFKSRVLEVDTPSALFPTVKIVEAIKRGTTKPDEWIMFVAHYDTAIGSTPVLPAGPATIQGAYDDGSGTNMMRFFAKAFSKVKTKRSIALFWFDAEEQGLLGSEALAPILQKRKQKVAGVLGFDMVGIGYPAPYCICLYHGALPQHQAVAVPILRYVNFDYLKFPEGDGEAAATQDWPVGGTPHVCLCGPNVRNSDESSFAQMYPTFRWAGMRTARDYPGYHQPWDTVPFMELVAGGRDILEEGTYNTFISAYYTAMVLDNL